MRAHALTARAIAPGSARRNAPPAAPAAAVRRILQAPRVQPKLTVSAPDDAFEREADHVADQVMRMPETAAAGSAPPHVQRMCTDCEDEEKVQRAVAVNTPTPQTMVREEEVIARGMQFSPTLLFRDGISVPPAQFDAEVLGGVRTAGPPAGIEWKGGGTFP